MARRGFPITQAMQAERRKRAEDRIAEYHKKYPTLQARLDALPPTGANKQRARLQAAIQAEQDRVEAAKVAAAVKAEAKTEKSNNKKFNKEGK
jgi:hypothetical protein